MAAVKRPRHDDDYVDAATFATGSARQVANPPAPMNSFRSSTGQVPPDNLTRRPDSSFPTQGSAFAFQLPYRIPVYDPDEHPAKKHIRPPTEPRGRSDFPVTSGLLPSVEHQPPKSKKERKREKNRRRREALAAAAASSSSSVNPLKKKHDYGVWQVPDVAFSSDEIQAATPATTADVWSQLKLQALATKDNPIQPVPLKHNRNKCTRPKSPKPSAESSMSIDPDPRPIHPDPKPFDPHTDSIAAGIKDKDRSKRWHPQSRSQVYAQYRDSFRPGWREEIDSYRPAPREQSYSKPDQRPKQARDSYRPSIREPHRRPAADCYRPGSSRTSPSGNTRRPPAESFVAPPRQPRRDAPQTSVSQPSMNQTMHSQYQGLGQGIWPLSNYDASNTPMPYDIEHAFGQMQLNQPTEGPLANSYGGSNNVQHIYSGFTPSNHNHGFTPINRNTGLTHLNKSAAWSGPTSMWSSSLSPVAQPFTQTSSLHATVEPNRKAVNYNLKVEPAAPPKPDQTGRDPIIPSIAPIPSEAYMKQAANPPHRMQTPQPLLIVSDLNGTLISRSRSRKKLTSFKPRPGLAPFLSFLASTTDSAAKNFTFMIWTSARPNNTQRIVADLFKPYDPTTVTAVWARNTLGLTSEQFHGNTQVYKQLTRIWRDTALQAAHPHFRRGERWSQRNTLLIDDSVRKAASEPFNLVHIPELTPEALVREQRAAGPGVLAKVAEYIDEARWYADVSSYVRAHPFSMGASDAAGQSADADGDVKDDGVVSDDDDDDMDAGAAGVPIGMAAEAEYTAPGVKE